MSCFSFPGATNETLLQKFHKENKNNEFYEVPQKFEHAFLINHYAGKVKYQVSFSDEFIAPVKRLANMCVAKRRPPVFDFILWATVLPRSSFMGIELPPEIPTLIETVTLERFET